MPESNIGLNFAILIAIVSAAVGTFFGFLSLEYREWRKERRLRKNLISLLKLEIRSNIDLCELSLSDDDSETIPSNFHNDIYYAYLNRLNLLPIESIKHVLSHYRLIKRFETIAAIPEPMEPTWGRSVEVFSYQNYVIGRRQSLKSLTEGINNAGNEVLKILDNGD